MDKVGIKATGEKPGRKPKRALGPLTMRDAIVVLGGILVIVGSLFPIPWSKTVSVNMWIFPGLPFHLLIALVLPLLVAGGFAWRRFTGRTRVRIGSLSLDQAGSVVALIAAAYFFNSYVASMSPAYLIGFIGALAMVVGTTLASYFGAFRRDFATGGETLLGSDLAPVARNGAPSSGASAEPENKDPKSPTAKPARLPGAAKAADRPGHTTPVKEEPRDGASAQAGDTGDTGVKPGPAVTATGKPVPDSAVATGAAAGTSTAAASSAGSPTGEALSTPRGPAVPASAASPKREIRAAETPVSGASGSKAAPGVTFGSGAGTPAGAAKTPARGSSDKAAAEVKDTPVDSSRPDAQAEAASSTTNETTGGGTQTPAGPTGGDKAKPSGAAPKAPGDVRESSSETAAAKPETDQAKSTVPADSGTPAVPALSTSSSAARTDLDEVPAKESDMAGRDGGKAAAKPDVADASASDAPTPEAGPGKDAAELDGPKAKNAPSLEPGTVQPADPETRTSAQGDPVESSVPEGEVPGSAGGPGDPEGSAEPAAKAGVPVGGAVQATAALSRADLEAHRAAAQKAKAEAAAESSFGARAESSEPEAVSTSFWFALNHPRPVFHHLNGTMLETLYPGTWILCVEDRGSDYFINLPDGRPAVLRNLDDLQFPER
ncbi:MAG: hypothetical protein Q4P23_05150 [Micrococcaceae bacterium]|nr:hypothetical protein [Micrococcaceae bacterium]